MEKEDFIKEIEDTIKFLEFLNGNELWRKASVESNNETLDERIKGLKELLIEVSR